MRAKRERAKLNGWCTSCGKDWTQPGMKKFKPIAGTVTCWPCNESAKGRVKASRA